MIQDDPAFLPDLAWPGLDADLSAFDISTDSSSRWSSVLSPHSQRSSLSSQHDADGSMLGLIIPTSDTGGAGELGGFQLPSEHASSALRNERFERLLEDDGEALDIDPGFSIDAQGNFIEDPIAGSDVGPGPLRLGSDSAASPHVRQELEEGVRQGHSNVSLWPMFK